jgi:hypothetical protein
MKPRWENYILNINDDFDKFWKDYYVNENRETLFIIGIGFDPRSIKATEIISSIPSKGNKDILGLRYFANDGEEASNFTPPEVQINIEKLNILFEKKNIQNISYKGIVMRSADDKHIADINTTRLISSIDDIKKYNDVIIDISAMPRGIFIPLLNKLLSLIDMFNNAEHHINLHVVVTENAKLDSRIQDLGSADEATFIHGFSVPDQTQNKELKRVWIPMLGEAQTKQFDTIQKSIEPGETCVMLPFPSKDLKRGDLILDEYQKLLFSNSDFDPKNIVYVSESNPFHVYRQLTQTIKRYQKSFKLLNGCKIIVSALSSKILSLGAFMAVYEAKKGDQGRQNIGIKQVESLSHKIADNSVKEVDKMLVQNTSIHLWLAGSPYIE